MSGGGELDGVWEEGGERGGRCKEMKEERKKKGGGGKALSLFILSFSFRVVSSREYQ